MPLPVRSLTVLQNWDCQGCTSCCRQYHVSVSAEERKRIEGQGWENEPDLKGVPFFIRSGGWFSSSYRLNHGNNGACVFLGPDNRCRIHVKFGSAAKPLACRIYPYSLVPAGDHWKLGLRFACPSSVEDRGKPLSEHLSEAREYAAVLEAEAGTQAITIPPPPLQGKQQISWGDLGRIITTISELFAQEEETIERRWRKVLFVVSTLRNAKFDGGGDPKKAITGARLNELLTILSEASEDEIPDDPEEVPAPGWVGRTVFRQVSALYARKDTGPDRGSAQSNAFARLFSAMQFARGRGTIPQTHASIPRTTFAAAEKPFDEISERSEAILARWARVKIESGQFCGPTNFDMPVWDGLESLAVAFAAAMWLARVLATDGRPSDGRPVGRPTVRQVDDAIMAAVRIVDDNYGFNPLLGQARQKFALRLLGKQGELPKLVAWYGRAESQTS